MKEEEAERQAGPSFGLVVSKEAGCGGLDERRPRSVGQPPLNSPPHSSSVIMRILLAFRVY